jgi:RNA polymerase primary sigma factor
VADVVADEAVMTPFEQVRDKTESALVRHLVDLLPEREARILRLRFGLDNDQEQTLESIGLRLKLTRERIRQLQNAALARLRLMLEDPTQFPMVAQPQV